METNRPTPNTSGNSSATSSTSDETDNVDQNDEENWDFDEPHCRWKFPGQNDEDCGEGVICPPCG